MSKIIAIANQKGGVGKTTTAVTLGHALALRGKPTLLVDCDPQGQVATFLGVRQESGLFDLLVNMRPLADVTRHADANGNIRPGLRLVPGDKRTATAQGVMALEGFRLSALADVLWDAKTDYDYIILDTSPSVGLLQEAALYAADWLLIPSAVDYASTEGLTAVLGTLTELRKRGGDCRLLGIVPTFYDEITTESRDTLEQLREHLRDAVWEPIHRATILRECAADGMTIFEKAPQSRAAREYEALAERVMDHG